MYTDLMLNKANATGYT